MPSTRGATAPPAHHGERKPGPSARRRPRGNISADNGPHSLRETADHNGGQPKSRNGGTAQILRQLVGIQISSRIGYAELDGPFLLHALVTSSLRPSLAPSTQALVTSALRNTSRCHHDVDGAKEAEDHLRRGALTPPPLRSDRLRSGRLRSGRQIGRISGPPTPIPISLSAGGRNRVGIPSGPTRIFHVAPQLDSSHTAHSDPHSARPAAQNRFSRVRPEPLPTEITQHRIRRRPILYPTLNLK
jgi:hypothetical protein